MSKSYTLQVIVMHTCSEYDQHSEMHYIDPVDGVPDDIVVTTFERITGRYPCSMCVGRVVRHNAKPNTTYLRFPIRKQKGG